MRIEWDRKGKQAEWPEVRWISIERAYSKQKKQNGKTCSFCPISPEVDFLMSLNLEYSFLLHQITLPDFISDLLQF